MYHGRRQNVPLPPQAGTDASSNDHAQADEHVPQPQPPPAGDPPSGDTAGMQQPVGETTQDALARSAIRHQEEAPARAHWRVGDVCYALYDGRSVVTRHLHELKLTRVVSLCCRSWFLSRIRRIPEDTSHLEVQCNHDNQETRWIARVQDLRTPDALVAPVAPGCRVPDVDPLEPERTSSSSEESPVRARRR